MPETSRQEMSALDGAPPPGALAAARGSEDRYRKLIYHMPVALWQIDARGAGRIMDRLRAEGVTDIAAHFEAHPEIVQLGMDVVLVTEANRDAIALFNGSGPAALAGPVRYIFAASPDSARRVMIAHFEGRRNYTEQTRIRTFDGQIRDVVMSVTFPAPPEDPDTTFLMLSDITERLKTEAQLRRLQADHARAARLTTLGEMATSIAHEIRQPLAAIVANGEANLRWLSREDADLDKVRQLTGRMVSSALRASEIIQRIRRMAVNDQPSRLPVDLVETAREALHFVRHDLESRSVELVMRSGPSLPKVAGDRIQLQQVIVNLLVNSLQAMAQPDVGRRAIEIDISAAERTGNVWVAIRDTGPGIAASDLPRVFDSFFTRKEGGIGIGLAICQSIIAAHGGSISAGNHPGGGARFRFSLPAAADPG